MEREDLFRLVVRLGTMDNPVTDGIVLTPGTHKRVERLRSVANRCRCSWAWSRRRKRSRRWRSFSIL
jgi:hypothetical protein